MADETLEEVCARHHSEPPAGIKETLERDARQFRECADAWAREKEQAYDTVDREALTTLGDQFYTRDAVLQAMERAAAEMRSKLVWALGMDSSQGRIAAQTGLPDVSAILTAMPMPRDAQDEATARRIENADLRAFNDRLLLDKKGLKAELAGVRAERDNALQRQLAHKEKSELLGRELSAERALMTELNKQRDEDRAAAEKRIAELLESFRIVQDQHSHSKEDFVCVVQENRDIRKSFNDSLLEIAARRDEAQKEATALRAQVERAVKEGFSP